MANDSGLEEALADIERDAGQIVTWEPWRIPGLAQTEAITAAILGVLPLGIRREPEAITATMHFRQQRQQTVFEGSERPLMEMFIGEGALHSLAAHADREAARAQFWHLQRLSGLCTVRVAAFESGIVAWPQAPIHLVCGPRGRALLLEKLHGEDELITSADHIRWAEQDIDYLREHALSPDSSQQLIARIGGIRYGRLGGANGVRDGGAPALSGALRDPP